MKGVAPRHSIELTPRFSLEALWHVLVPFLYIISDPLPLNAELLILKYHIREYLPTFACRRKDSCLSSVSTIVSIPFLAVSEM